MIHLYDETVGIYIYLDGRISETPTRLGANTIMSTRGRRFQEYTRSVIDLTLEVYHMSEEDYNSLKAMFLNPNSTLYIEDLDTGKTYIDYLFSDDRMSLSRMEDYGNKRYYYKGSLNLIKS